MGRVRGKIRERVLLVSASEASPAAIEADLNEVTELVSSAGGLVVGVLTQRRGRTEGPDLLGKGKMAELEVLCGETKADVVVTQQSLGPGQQRRLEDSLPCRLVDRTMLILDIFAQRARSGEGKLQVELAQLLYRLPRLKGKGVELSRLGGGLGTRGPGEQELEYGRRRIRERISRLKKEIDHLRERRGKQRARRHEKALPSVVLAGYTNAGKSTLLSSLTRTKVFAKDQMFSTLDPQVRVVRLPGGGRALLCDTVGFISHLPETLKVAFRATLEEIAEADAIIHVVDAAHADSDSHMAAVKEELAAIGAGEVPVLTAFNKTDLLRDDPGRVMSLTMRERPSVAISALDGGNLDRLLAELEDSLRSSFWKRVVLVNPDQRVLAMLARLGASVRRSGKGGEDVEAWIAPAHTGVLRKAVEGESG